MISIDAVDEESGMPRDFNHTFLLAMVGGEEIARFSASSSSRVENGISVTFQFKMSRLPLNEGAEREVAMVPLAIDAAGNETLGEPNIILQPTTCNDPCAGRFDIVTRCGERCPSRPRPDPTPSITVSPTNFSVSPGDNRIVSVTFTPMSTGIQSATITFSSNSGSPSVSVSGRGTAAPPADVAPNVSSANAAYDGADYSPGNTIPVQVLLVNLAISELYYMSSLEICLKKTI